MEIQNIVNVELDIIKKSITYIDFFLVNKEKLEIFEHLWYNMYTLSERGTIYEISKKK